MEAPLPVSWGRYAKSVPPGTWTKVGGQPVGFPAEQWPVCPETAEPMTFLLQIDLGDPIDFGLGDQVAYLFSLPIYDSETFECIREPWIQQEKYTRLIVLPKSEYTMTPGPSIGKEFGVFWKKGLDEEWHRQIPEDIDLTLLESEMVDDDDTETFTDPLEEEDFSDLEAEFAQQDAMEGLGTESQEDSSEDEIEYPPEPDEWPSLRKRQLKNLDDMMSRAEVKLGGMETWVNFVWVNDHPPADARFLASFCAWYRNGEDVLNLYTPEYLYLFIKVETDGSVRHFARYQCT